jgi:hypothetical protein
MSKLYFHRPEEVPPVRILNAYLRKYVGAGIGEEWKAILEVGYFGACNVIHDALVKRGHLVKGRLVGNYRYYVLSAKGKKWLEPLEMRSRMF